MIIISLLMFSDLSPLVRIDCLRLYFHSRNQYDPSLPVHEPPSRSLHCGWRGLHYAQLHAIGPPVPSLRGASQLLSLSVTFVVSFQVAFAW